MPSPTHQSDTLAEQRHTLAHLLAAAVLERYPHAKPTIGPAIDTGFYYDFDFTTTDGSGSAPGEADLPALEARMRELLAEWTAMTGEEVSEATARERFAGNPFKQELIDGIVAAGDPITLYSAGGFTDLCRGGHCASPAADIPANAFALERIAGAYWRGDENNPMLSRIYGLAFASKEALDAYRAQQEDARARDHKKLGKELDLFTFSETIGKGLPLWTPKGTTIRRELERFIVDEELARGYLHVVTPDIAKLGLYEKSGHFPHYKESMYAPIDIDGDQFMLRPMTCPHHFELFLRKPVSYRELPMRIAELAQLYRYEQSGELAGLERVRTFCLADAHIICATEEQAVAEVGAALDLIEYVADVLGLAAGTDYSYRLSLGNRANREKYYENDAAWEKGEALLRDLLTERGAPFVEAADEAAFYGPKIDIQMRNVNGKENTAFTVQYDFCMPDRFDLTYIAEDGTKKRAFVVHRSSIGAIERIMAFLIERYGGAFPTWLSPTQVRVLPVAQAHGAYAEQIVATLRAAGVRVDHVGDDSLGKRIRGAKMEKIPYLIVVGDAEVEAGTVTAESRDLGKLEPMSLESFVSRITQEIKDRA